ncbi:hypothetical protein L9G16_17995 [Shewanella sp. A25]|nr:hypothetical protein [Shewanella shenzhenensis]
MASNEYKNRFVSAHNQLLFQYLSDDEFETLATMMTYQIFRLKLKEIDKVSKKDIVKASILTLKNAAKRQGLRDEGLCRYDSFLSDFINSYVKDSNLVLYSLKYYQKMREDKITNINDFIDKHFDDLIQDVNKSNTIIYGLKINKAKIIVEMVNAIYEKKMDIDKNKLSNKLKHNAHFSE